MLVDAGYLIAEGAKAFVSASARRADVTVDHAAMVASLCRRARRESGLPLLRLYWYDGAVEAVPTSEQLRIAGMADVKLRLGRISGGRQKGVDSLIYRDLSLPSRERAVSDFFLVAGDEDLREGVVAAQEVGARVTLWSVGAGNQARTLFAEADCSGQLDDVSGHFSVSPGSAWGMKMSAAPASVSSLETIRATGATHAVQWLARATADELGELLAARPSIPATLDAELLRLGQATHGDLRGLDDARKALRAGFWDGVTASRTPGR